MSKDTFLNKKNLLILGAGQYGYVLKEIAQATEKYDRISFLDDYYSDEVIGKLEEFSFFTNQFEDAIVAIGNPDIRLKWIKHVKEEFNVPVIIHPMAYVSPSATLGIGSVVEPMAVIHTSVVIGVGCIISAGSVVNHNSLLEDGVHCDCGCVVPARMTVKTKRKIVQGEWHN